jgi:Fe-S cluster biogenesis protein NfuA
LTAASDVSPAGIVPEDLSERLRIVSHLLSAHGGSVELDSISDTGVVRVRFKGLCASCALRPITLESIIRPLITSLPGVSAVEVSGLTISGEARARLASLIASEQAAARPPVKPLVRLG